MAVQNPTAHALPQWVPVAGTVLAGVLSFAGVIIGRKMRPAATPVTMQEVWLENRNLRDRLITMEAEAAVFRSVVDIVLPHIETIVPNLTSAEARMVDEARALRAKAARE